VSCPRRCISTITLSCDTFDISPSIPVSGPSAMRTRSPGWKGLMSSSGASFWRDSKSRMRFQRFPPHHRGLLAEADDGGHTESGPYRRDRMRGRRRLKKKVAREQGLKPCLLPATTALQYLDSRQIDGKALARKILEGSLLLANFGMRHIAGQRRNVESVANSSPVPDKEARAMPETGLRRNSCTLSCIGFIPWRPARHRAVALRFRCGWPRTRRPCT
jgi:hypothetical protein